MSVESAESNSSSLASANFPVAKSAEEPWPYAPHLIVFLSSVGIMVIELLAARLIGRHLGGSLYTWTAVIGVMMAGMSIGNYVGGRLADRHAPQKLLALLLAASVIACLLMLGLNFLFASVIPLKFIGSWPTRILITVFAIFTLPALAMGTIVPVAAKMAIERSKGVGAAVGSVYAWNAAGSILGTMAAGFYLIPHFGVVALTLFTIVCLALLAVGIRWLRVPKNWVPMVWVLTPIIGVTVFHYVQFWESDLVSLGKRHIASILPCLGMAIFMLWSAIKANAKTGEENPTISFTPPMNRFFWKPSAISFALAFFAGGLAFDAKNELALDQEFFGLFALLGIVAGHFPGRLLAQTKRDIRALVAVFLSVTAVLIWLAQRTDGLIAFDLQLNFEDRSAIMIRALFPLLMGFLVGLFPIAAENADTSNGKRSGSGRCQAWAICGWLAGFFVFMGCVDPQEKGALWTSALGFGAAAFWTFMTLVPTFAAPVIIAFGGLILAVGWFGVAQSHSVLFPTLIGLSPALGLALAAKFHLSHPNKIAPLNDEAESSEAWRPQAYAFFLAVLAGAALFAAFRLAQPHTEKNLLLHLLKTVTESERALITDKPLSETIIPHLWKMRLAFAAIAAGLAALGHFVGWRLATFRRHKWFVGAALALVAGTCAILLNQGPQPGCEICSKSFYFNTEGFLNAARTLPPFSSAYFALLVALLALPAFLSGFFVPQVVAAFGDGEGKPQPTIWTQSGWMFGALLFGASPLADLHPETLLRIVTFGLALLLLRFVFVLLPERLRTTYKWFALTLLALWTGLATELLNAQVFPAYKWLFGASIIAPALLIGAAVFAFEKFRGKRAESALPTRRDEDASGVAETGVSPVPAPTGWARFEPLNWKYAPHAIAFCGAGCFMAVEIAAGRLTARHLGSSLYTWTSIIGVMLAGMTIGYYLGGRMADRLKLKYLPGALCCAASMTLVSALLLDCWLQNKHLDHNVWVWRAFHGIWNGWWPSAAMTYGAPEMAWPWRILLVVSTVYFLPALVLGMISPTAAKLALRRSKFTGATIGGVYAWGTIGSITGTLTAGFFLIAFIGAPNVLLAAAAVTGLLGLTLGPVRLYHGVWLLFLCAVFVASDLNPIKDGTESAAECLIAEESADESNPKPWRERLTKRLKQKGERWGLRPDISDVVFAMDGNYQYVKVYDKNSTKGTGTIRTLCLDYLIHGYVDLDDPSHLEYDYELVYRDLTRKYMGEKADISAFFMGGGSYTFQRWVLNEWPGANIVVAEIDPLVLKANHNALGLPSDTPIQTRIGDARNVLDDQPNKKIFDLFFADAFNDFSVPWHLTTKEFAESVKRRLKPDGVFLVNIIDDFRFGKFIGATYLTLKEVFPHVYVFCTDQAGVNMRRDTFVVAASETPHDFSAWGPKHSADFNGSLLTQENLDELRKKCENLILTDDHAPVENLLAPMVRTRQ